MIRFLLAALVVALAPVVSVSIVFGHELVRPTAVVEVAIAVVLVLAVIVSARHDVADVDGAGAHSP